MSALNKTLKHVNSLPFPVTMKHYFAFDDSTDFLKDGKLNSRESWDLLRQNHPHFSISENREEWLRASEAEIRKDGQDHGIAARAQDIVQVIDRLGVNSLFSVGVGGAGLEYQIKKIKPEIKLTCSEYSPVAVAALKKVFTEADSIVLFDMKSKDWPKEFSGKNQLTLMYRIDIDISNSEFREMFKNMHNSGIENILIILCGRLTLRGLLNRFYQRLKWKMHGTKYAFAGYLRSEKTFLPFWDGLYESEKLECAGLKSFLLKRVNRV